MSPPHKEYKPHPELQKHIDFQKEGMYVPDQPVVGFSPPSTHFWLQARGIEIIEDDDDDDMTLHFDELDAAATEVSILTLSLQQLHLTQLFLCAWGYFRGACDAGLMAGPCVHLLCLAQQRLSRQPLLRQAWLWWDVMRIECEVGASPEFHSACACRSPYTWSSGRPCSRRLTAWRSMRAMTSPSAPL